MFSLIPNIDIEWPKWGKVPYHLGCLIYTKLYSLLAVFCSFFVAKSLCLPSNLLKKYKIDLIAALTKAVRYLLVNGLKFIELA